MKKIILTGGGTGGHVFPALSLIPDLESQGFLVEYIGSNGIEKDILKKHPNLPYHEIPAVKLERKLTLKNLLIPFKLFKSIRRAKKILREAKPNIVFSKGGFVAVPVAIAAKQLKIPVVSHESDLTFGLANKIILRYAKVMCTNFLETAQKTKKGRHTGAPIRSKIYSGNRATTLKKVGFKNPKPVLLVLGGSLGAVRLNDAIEANINQLLKTYNLVHITGKHKTNIERDGYLQLEFADEIENYYSLADLCISRAGAGVIFELLALKKPMLLVPLSKACSRGDQIDNAKKFHEMGYCEYVLEEELTPEKLNREINNLYKNREKYIKNMEKYSKINGNENIIKIITEII